MCHNAPTTDARSLLVNGGSWNDRSIQAAIGTNDAGSRVANAADDIFVRSNMRFNSRTLLQDTADVNEAAHNVNAKLVDMAAAVAARVSAAGRALLQDTADVNEVAHNVNAKLMDITSATMQRISNAGRSLLQSANIANNYADSMTTNTAVINAGSASVSKAAADILASVNRRFASAAML